MHTFVFATDHAVSLETTQVPIAAQSKVIFRPLKYASLI